MGREQATPSRRAVLRIQADGSDATRLTFRALDAYGNQRPYVPGDVTLTLAGPATLVGDNPFPFGSYGGVGGSFARSAPGRTGPVGHGHGGTLLARARHRPADRHARARPHLPLTSALGWLRFSGIPDG